MLKKTLAFSLITAVAFCSISVHAKPIEEVPFITSPDNVTLEMLSSAGVTRGDHMIDLGSGDGRREKGPGSIFS